MDQDVRTFRIDLGYDGTDFWGSQRQPGRRTVQGELEAALAALTGQAAPVTLAGRTDRGVHAVGQVASVAVRWRRSPRELARGLDALTPDDLAVYGAHEVEEGFHARFSARRREYRYRIWEGERPPLLLRRYVWQVRRPLDLPAMQAAAASLVGRRDFAAVAGSGTGVPGAGVETTRRVRAAEWRVLPQRIEPTGREGRLLEFAIEADAFLPQMVRNIVGDLVAIGTGRRPIDWMASLLEARDRRRGEAPAPPHGLVLWRVSYDEPDPDVETEHEADGTTGVGRDEDILAEGV